MTTEPEVHFCNVCNQSVPESALACGAAVRVEGRIVPIATPDQGGAASVGPAKSGSVVGAVFVVLVALVGVAIFIDLRLTESEARLRNGVGGLAAPIDRNAERLDALDRRLASTAAAADLVPMRESVDGLRETLRSDLQDVQEAMLERLKALDDIVKDVQRGGDAQVQLTARLALLQDELRALAKDVAELRARPAAVPTPAIVERPDAGAGPVVETGLPPAIAHQVSRLGDADDATRFEAVDQLLLTKDERIYGYLLPLAKDPDMFVRRLVLEGLADHHAASSVEALLDALADPVELVRHTAHVALKRVTAQDIAFDPAASAEQRAGMQRKWRQWWDKAKDSF